MTKFCVDCKHCVPVTRTHWNFTADNTIAGLTQNCFYYCHHPKAVKYRETDLVTGQMQEEYYDCRFMRTDCSKVSEHHCTKDAEWFEPKEPQVIPEPHETPERYFDWFRKAPKIKLR